MPDRRSVGRTAEDRAAEHILGLGYTLVTRRHAMRGGELDLVALDGDTVVFVEVRQRSGAGQSPEESIDDRKAKHLARAAERYMREMGDKRPIRFDLVAIDPDGLRHHKDFFRPGYSVARDASAFDTPDDE